MEFYEIEEIEEIDYENYVYDIEVEDNHYFKANNIYSHNCRLISDTEMLDFASQSNSFGAGATSTLGSHRVATINFNRIALECVDLDDFWRIYQQRIRNARDILKAHKILIKSLANNGLQMFIDKGWINMSRMFSTFGLLGLYEMQKTLEKRFNIKEDYIEKCLNEINDRVKKYTKETSEFVWNIETIPAESYAVRLAKIDKLIFSEEKVPYEMYANQFVPLWEDASIWEKMDIDGKYNQLITGGGIVHAQLGEKITSTQAKEIIEYSIKSGCEHFALNPVYSQCENNHMTLGSDEKCSVCGAEIKEKYTRVVGFFTPVSSWNKTRREWEFPKRTFTKF